MTSIFPKAGWMLAGVLALYVLSALAGVVTGGPLDPPGAPAPSTFLPPSWHGALTAAGADSCATQRFDCVLGDQAVLDHETGLVWERDAASATGEWEAAFDACAKLELPGGRNGWRLPKVSELSSLRDNDAQNLPPGHPFQNVADIPYWTITGSPLFVQVHYAITFDAPFVIGTYVNAGLHGTWCVRAAGGE
jgi:hypothetical protein